MKICLINLIFCCLHGFFLHKAMPADTGIRKDAFSGTVKARDLSGQQQFERALSWFTQVHFANFGEIEVGDPAQGVLKAKGFIQSQVSGTAFPNLYKINFTFLIRLLSGVYQYELLDFRMVPFKKGRYCPEREKSFAISSFQQGNSFIESKSRHNKIAYQQAVRIAQLISSSIQQTLSKN